MNQHIETLKQHLPGLTFVKADERGVVLSFCGNVTRYANGVSFPYNHTVFGLLPEGAAHSACDEAVQELLKQYSHVNDLLATRVHVFEDPADRYAATGELALPRDSGNDVARLLNAIIATEFAPGFTFDSNSTLIKEFRKEVKLTSPTDIEWAPGDNCSNDFNVKFTKVLDELVCHGFHPCVAGEDAEELNFVSGRIGCIAVRSEMTNWDGADKGSMALFVARTCATPEEAVALARKWAIAEAHANAAESVHAAVNFLGQITGCDNKDVLLADLAESTSLAVREHIGDEPDEDALTAYFAQRIADSNVSAEDLPRSLARYGLMTSTAFLLEMMERMESTEVGA